VAGTNLSQDQDSSAFGVTRLEKATKWLERRREITPQELAKALRLSGKHPDLQARELLLLLRWSPRADGVWQRWNAKRGWSTSAADGTRLLEHMKKGGLWDRTQAAEILGLTKIQAMYTLRLLVDSGLVTRQGEYKNAFYYATNLYS